VWFEIGLWRAVSRLVCVGETYAANLTLDVNTEVYPVAIGEKIKVAIAKTLRLDGKAGEIGYDQSGQVLGPLPRVFSLVVLR
jgi:hypothetical protein